MEAIQKDHEENIEHAQSMERSTHMDSAATMYIKPSIRISISTVIIQCPLHLLAFIYSPNRKSSIVHTQAGSPLRLDCRGTRSTLMDWLRPRALLMAAIPCHLMLILTLRGCK